MGSIPIRFIFFIDYIAPGMEILEGGCFFMYNYIKICYIYKNYI